VTLAGILRQHWPDYVARQRGPSTIPAPHWRAVEAVLSCRTPRLGGHVHRCTDCGGEHYAYHSCNHRGCPRCGAREQELWAARQQARLPPVPYYMLTFTVPRELRGFFRRHERIAYAALFAAGSGAVKDLFADPKYFGGEAGMTAVLHTWTRQIDYHPHLHVVVPAVALAPGGCAAIRAKDPEFLLPHAPLAPRYRARFLAGVKDKHSDLFGDIPEEVRRMPWNVNVQRVGGGKTALRYLAALRRQDGAPAQNPPRPRAATEPLAPSRRMNASVPSETNAQAMPPPASPAAAYAHCSKVSEKSIRAATHLRTMSRFLPIRTPDGRYRRAAGIFHALRGLKVRVDPSPSPSIPLRERPESFPQ